MKILGIMVTWCPKFTACLLYPITFRTNWQILSEFGMYVSHTFGAFAMKGSKNVPITFEMSVVCM